MQAPGDGAREWRYAPCHMRLGLTLALAASASLLAATAGARAQQQPPRRIWLDCAAPNQWPMTGDLPWRLSCRLQLPSSGPAYWETVNPFEPEELRLVDPFAIEATARYVDVFEKGRYARARRAAEAIPRLVDPFLYDLDEVIDPFAPYRKKRR